MGTKNDPGQFDCYANALPDEPMFILLARDPEFYRLVSDWASKRARDVACGLRPHSDMAAAHEAWACAAAGQKWRKENDGKWREPYHPDRCLPPCMMPDGGHCCEAHSTLASDWHKQSRQIEQLRTQLERVRQEVVLAIAFLGRDAGTSRLDITANRLCERLVKVDAEIRGLQPSADLPAQ